MSPTPDVVLDAGAVCGESPVWDQEAGVLWWTDIPVRTVNRLDPATGRNEACAVEDRVGCLVLDRAGGLVVAAERRFCRLDPATGALATLARLEGEDTQNRLNDGRCDRRGRLFAGTMNEPRARRSGRLWRLDPDGSLRALADDVLVANGLAWSPDDRIMYWSDSRRGLVFTFDYDIGTGTPSNRRVWLETDDSIGRPDGAAVDSEGCYWSARFMGGRVIRFRPDGTIDREIRLPVSRVTMCAFGGADLRTLYIATASEGISAQELKAEPLAGAIFAVDAGVAGLPEPRFAGR
jgi:sugar lactone lactonase YvrE